MKVLTVNAFDCQGGAARAAFRLHSALLAASVDSWMLVQNKVSDSFRVLGPSSPTQKAIATARSYLDQLPTRRYPSKTQTLFSPAWVPFSSLAKRINREAPDIVHLHWVTNGMLNPGDIAQIRAPVVWTLHDMWPFTGGCHYDENCGLYKSQCGSCKVLKSCKNNDLSAVTFGRKKRAYAQKKDITIVGLSRWIAAEASKSTLLSPYPVFNLPNPIDADVFSPYDQVQARQLLGLPTNRKLILFGAIAATSDPRKGFDSLKGALERLSVPDAELVVFGASVGESDGHLPLKTHYLGKLTDDVSLRLLYNAADVLVVPSLQENLSNAIMESLACGTAVVGFDIGGNRDFIEHKGNGFLAAPFEASELAEGIRWALEQVDPSELSKMARETIVGKFDAKTVAEKYIELYRSILRREI